MPTVLCTKANEKISSTTKMLSRRELKDIRTMFKLVTISFEAIKSLIGERPISSSKEDFHRPIMQSLSAYKEKYKSFIAQIKQEALNALKSTAGYEILKNIFTIQNIHTVKSVNENSITLIAEDKNGELLTLLLTINSNENMYYCELPANLKAGETSTSGSLKKIVKRTYNEEEIVFMYDFEPENMQKRNASLLKMQRKIDNLIQRGIEGAELISVPALVLEERNTNLLVQSLTGKSDLEALAVEELEKGIVDIKQWKNSIRDMYMANSALQALGYYNCDTKLQNAVIIPTGRVATIDIDMIGVDSNDPLFTFSMLRQAQEISHTAIKNTSIPLAKPFFALLHPPTLLKELDRGIHGGVQTIEAITTANCNERIEKEVLGFIVCDEPQVFLQHIYTIYKLREDTQSMQRIQHISDEYNNAKNNADNWTQYDSIQKRRELSELLRPRDKKIISENYTELYRKSLHNIAKNIQENKDILEDYEGFRIIEEDSEKIKEKFKAICLSKEGIKRQIHDIREKLHIDKETATDEDLEIFVRFYHDIYTLVPKNPSLEHIYTLADTMDRTLSNILAVEEYTKAETQSIFQKIQCI